MYALVFVAAMPFCLLEGLHDSNDGSYRRFVVAVVVVEEDLLREQRYDPDTGGGHWRFVEDEADEEEEDVE